MSKNTLVDQVESRSESIENDLNARGILTDLEDSFTTKYRLEFGDDYSDFTYRLIIQKRGYVGAILPIIGTNDPVVIKWEGDDDFYEPIKGSQCTINLMVTDSVSYDDFYNAPEKTYKVLVQWYGADPVGGPNIWNTFWSGWLVSDTFKELVNTKPFPITLTAIDGLGSVNGFKVNAAAYRPQYSTENSYPLQIKLIADILRNIDLKLQIYANHEWLQYRPANPFLPQNTAAFDSFIQEGEQMNAKEILSAILKSTNSRIFQSDNKWCIIPNSCYEADGFSTIIANEAVALGYQPTNIRNTKTNYLITNNSEIINFERFDQYGNYLSIASSDVHIALPADVQNVGGDLVVEYLPPYKEVSLNYNIEPYNRRKYQANPNQFFNYANTGYDLSEGVIGQYDYTLGNSLYSYRALQYVTNGAIYIPMVTTTLQATTENEFVRRGQNMSLNIQFIYDTDAPSINNEFRYTIKYRYSSTTLYYDDVNETWSPTIKYIASTSERNNINKTWDSASLDFKLPTGFDPQVLEVIMYRPLISGTGFYNALYIGEVSLQAEDLSEQQIHNYRSVQAESSEVYEQERTSVEHITGVQTFPDYQVPNGQLARRPRDNYFAWTVLRRTNRAQVINREIMNDFRSSMHRYEGTFKNNHYKPLSMLNRLWINFGASVMQLPDSCMIDTIEANLKRNAYKINMHLPNIDSDQLAVETNQFKK
jgi:hypothetical protein